MKIKSGTVVSGIGEEKQGEEKQLRPIQNSTGREAFSVSKRAPPRVEDKAQAIARALCDSVVAIIPATNELRYEETYVIYL
jgi:hypothetical protein